jgi:prophage regulatory protein
MAGQSLSILRRKAVEARTGLSRSSIYEYIAKGQFPSPIRLGDRAVGWVSDDIDQWLARQVKRSRSSGRKPRD